MTGMTKKAGPVLTPLQKQTVEQASAMLRRFDPRRTELGRWPPSARVHRADVHPLIDVGNGRQRSGRDV